MGFKNPVLNEKASVIPIVIYGDFHLDTENQSSEIGVFEGREMISTEPGKIVLVSFIILPAKDLT